MLDLAYHLLVQISFLWIANLESVLVQAWYKEQQRDRGILGNSCDQNHIRLTASVQVWRCDNCEK